MTPMMEQYFEVKNQYRDYVLFYRLGDFYEMFFDDAIRVSRELELTLTGRDCGEAERAPMCGVPFHSADNYIARLIEKGYKVAICEQVEDPALAKGLVKREVVRVITPGTLIEPTMLSEHKNNYLCAVYFAEEGNGICFADVSTGELFATVLQGANMESRMLSDMGTYRPSEVVFNLPRSRASAMVDFATSHLKAVLTDAQASRFEYGSCREAVRDQFGAALREEMLENKLLVCAVGGLLDYLREMQKNDLSGLKGLSVYSEGQFLEMDLNTRRNLELTETMRAKEKKGSLLWVLDKTRTAPGARMLRQWIEHPLLNVAAIEERQGAIEELFGNYMLREEIGENLKNVLDIERLMSKIVYGTANAKDLKAVADTVAVIRPILLLMDNVECEELRRIRDTLDPLDELVAQISMSIVDQPPFTV